MNRFLSRLSSGFLVDFEATADKQTLSMFARTKGSHNSYGDGGVATTPKTSSLKAKYLSAFSVRFCFGFLLSVVLLVCCSCSTSRKSLISQPSSLIHTDTLYLNKVQYDSIYKNDSFLMDYHPSKDYIYLLDSVLVMKVDTMYIRDKNVEYKYKFLHDTCYVHQVDTIPVIQQVEVVKTEKYVPSIYKWSLGICITLVLLLILWLVLKYVFKR